MRTNLPVTANATVKKPYRVEVHDSEIGFYFRIVNDQTGKKTDWANYQSIAMLDDYCTATDYYLGDGTHLPLLRPKDLLITFAVQEA